MRFSLVVIHLIVLWFLVLWWRRWMWLIPFFWVISLIVWYYQRQQYLDADIATGFQQTLQTYGSIGAWMIFLWWVWHLLYIFGVLTYSTWFRLLGWHMLVYLFALLYRSKEVATIAHSGWWMSGLLILWQSLQFKSVGLTLDVLGMLIGLSFALYACIVFVFGTMWVKIERRLSALLFVFFQLTILIGVIQYTSELTIRTVLWWQIYLWILYALLQRSKQYMHDDHMSEWSEDDVLHRILRGEHIQYAGYTKSDLGWWWLWQSISDAIRDIQTRLPDRVFRVLGMLNLLLIAVQLLLIFTTSTGDTWYWIDIGFWVSMMIYVMNYFVLQQQGIVVRWQRAVTFLLINFGIYLTIYHIFGNEPVYLVGCGVIRSLMNGFLMIHHRYGKGLFPLTEEDYTYWLFGNMIAILANSYFMFLLPMSAQLRFTLVIIYLSLQGLMLRYQVYDNPSNWQKS